MNREEMEKDLGIINIFIIIGILFLFLFGGLYLYRTKYMNGEKLCGIDENEICTSQTTDIYGITALTSLNFVIVGVLIKVFFMNTRRVGPFFPVLIDEERYQDDEERLTKLEAKVFK